MELLNSLLSSQNTFSTKNMKHLQTKKEYGSLNRLVGGGLGRSGAAADKSPLIFGNENGVAKTLHNLSSSWPVVEPSPPCCWLPSAALFVCDCSVFIITSV